MVYHFLDHEDRKCSPLGLGPLMHTGESKETLRGYPLKKLLKDCEVLNIKGDKHVLISHIASDSRRVGPQSLFFAIPGFRQDGHFFLEEALRRGAVALVTDQKLKLLPALTVVQVKDVRAVLAKVARAFYQEPDCGLSFIGVTGTNGKTTVTFLLHHLLHTAENPVGLLGTIVYDLGKRTIPAHRTTPDALELYGLLGHMKQNGCKQVVMEVSSHGIDQKRIAGLRFDVGVFLNLSQDHLDYHGSMEDYFQTKLRFFTEGYYPKKVAINIDDPYGKRVVEALPADVEVITFGMSPEAKLRGEQLMLSPRGARFNVIADGLAGSITSGITHIAADGIMGGIADGRINGGGDDIASGRAEGIAEGGVGRVDSMADDTVIRVEGIAEGGVEGGVACIADARQLRIESPLVGGYNVSNVLAVWAVLKLLGRPLEGYVEKLKTFTGVPGRLEKVEAGQAYTIVVDYAHTDDALKNMLTSVRKVTGGKLLVVFGCGGDRDKQKRSKMTEAVQTYADYAWATADNPRTEALSAIFEDMQKGVLDPDKISFTPCRRTAIRLALEAACSKEDTVVIAGKGHETYQEYSHTIVPFDDRLVAKELVYLKGLAKGLANPISSEISL